MRSAIAKYEITGSPSNATESTYSPAPAWTSPGDVDQSPPLFVLPNGPRRQWQPPWQEPVPRCRTAPAFVQRGWRRRSEARACDLRPQGSAYHIRFLFAISGTRRKIRWRWVDGWIVGMKERTLKAAENAPATLVTKAVLRQGNFRSTPDPQLSEFGVVFKDLGGLHMSVSP